MPAATKDHRSKKNSQANEAFNRRRAALSQGDETHRQFQRLWRIACIKDRMARGVFTDKNKAELERLDAAFTVKRS